MKLLNLQSSSLLEDKPPQEWKEDLLKFFLSSPAFDYHIGDLDDFLFPYCNWLIALDENTQEVCNSQRSNRL